LTRATGLPTPIGMAIAMSRPARSTIASAQRTASLERKGKAVPVVVVRVSSTNAVSVGEE
jgi:hypothetical protein